ncbi:OsmC family protein [Chitinophaga pinensis]|uniref:OsmC family protein n=1 Tax=Chitinophaga pinensis (strain ATCC 43595 / DSM 2588 / LMG 13176 / NBRC 15968 / NCIMB 11800 / UQM 2034) TaxID=485918 RepID=A0A979G9F8_CHIPD|nr:OsmC family protein [Chitinophaga pinensis]ACU63384.1 OsmC family protein [Chitinophaga pinensis DSM 2588]
MQPTVESRYLGNGKSSIVSPLNTEALNADSENFRPMNFLVGGYGTCMMSVMDMIAGQNGFNLSEARTEIRFSPMPDMSRLDTIDIKCFIRKGDYNAAEKQILEDAATKMCPIGNSLNPEIKRSYEFVYGVE